MERLTVVFLSVQDGTWSASPFMLLSCKSFDFIALVPWDTWMCTCGGPFLECTSAAFETWQEISAFAQGTSKEKLLWRTWCDPFLENLFEVGKVSCLLSVNDGLPLGSMQAEVLRKSLAFWGSRTLLVCGPSRGLEQSMLTFVLAELPFPEGSGRWFAKCNKTLECLSVRSGPGGCSGGTLKCTMGLASLCSADILVLESRRPLTAVAYGSLGCFIERRINTGQLHLMRGLKGASCRWRQRRNHGRCYRTDGGRRRRGARAPWENHQGRAAPQWCPRLPPRDRLAIWDVRFEYAAAATVAGIARGAAATGTSIAVTTIATSELSVSSARLQGDLKHAFPAPVHLGDKYGGVPL